MQKCSSCNAAIATVQILDLENGSVTASQFLCDACSKGGSMKAKKSVLSLPSDILESLLGGFASDADAAPGAAKSTTCPGCKLTLAEFRLRGRLGCPRCYDTFHDALVPLLERVHDATVHRGRFPGRIAPPPPPRKPSLDDLHNRLRSAIEQERYEDAAQIRDQLERAQRERRKESD